MSWVLIVLLVCSIAALIAAEWPRLAPRFARQRRTERARARRKSNLRLLRTEPRSESEEFEASVQADLSRLPTIEERDQKR